MLLDDIRIFKEKLKTGNVKGLFSKTMDPAFVEVAGFAGFDFIILDLEHGPNTVANIQNLIRGAQVSKILPIVRVKEDNYSIIGEVLDIGAAGIQIPQVTDLDKVKEILRRAKYAPGGERGVCRFVRAAEYSSMDRYEYFNIANESLIILQLEGEEAINNLDEILSIDGIDVIFIGPYDLSQSLGLGGQVEHPLVEGKMKEIISKCTEKDICIGTFSDTIENANKWVDLGVKYMAYSVDVGLFYEQCKSVLGSIK